jgi:hypothetical protein
MPSLNVAAVSFAAASSGYRFRIHRFWAETPGNAA